MIKSYVLQVLFTHTKYCRKYWIFSKFLVIETFGEKKSKLGELANIQLGAERYGCCQLFGLRNAFEVLSLLPSIKNLIVYSKVGDGFWCIDSIQIK